MGGAGKRRRPATPTLEVANETGLEQGSVDPISYFASSPLSSAYSDQIPTSHPIDRSRSPLTLLSSVSCHGSQRSQSQNHETPNDLPQDERDAAVRAQPQGQDVAALEEECRQLRQQYHQLQQNFEDLRDDREGIVCSLHWLDETLQRLHPPAVLAGATTTRPPLPFLDTPHKGGGGPKHHLPLQIPFKDELRHRMGLCSSDPLPPFEDPAPTLHGTPVLRFDWSKPTSHYKDLVKDILGELISQNPSVHDHVQAIGGRDQGQRLCMQSLSRLFKSWREQQGDAADPARRERRDSRRRRKSRAKKKSDAWAALLARDTELKRKYHNTDFALLAAASVEVTDAKQSKESGLEPQRSQTETGRAERLASASGAGDVGNSGNDREGGTSRGRRNQQLPLCKLVPSWRLLELHDALQRLDDKRQAEIASQPLPPVRTRTRLDPLRVEYPSVGASIDPLPTSIQRWMVSEEFSRLFPDVVRNVSRNTRIGDHPDSPIRDANQWGQHPPYRVYQASQLQRDNDRPMFFPSSNDEGSDENTFQSSSRSGQGEEVFSEAGPSNHLAPAHRCR
ncbi:uncharacterized protein UTRI_05546 [Ustilago trichophora]|uniref:Uncharacterized protein n=1 Tax=Ustilago trichophora TaxID=86804 RepID=A0A5C3EGA8_9BASI|nr:uncharacterized protein UTRI_05546 [Ustilago trichophora]